MKLTSLLHSPFSLIFILFLSMDLTTFRIIPRLLRFKQPAGTSRAVLRQRQVYYIVLRQENSGKISEGWGEIAPLEGLSPEDETFHSMMHSLTAEDHPVTKAIHPAEKYPSFRFGLEAAKEDLRLGGKRIWFDGITSHGKISVPINGLIWMGSKDEMYERIREKLKNGYPCLKLKIGGIDFEEEIELLRFIRQQFSAEDLELRLDANGSFSPENARERLQRLSEFEIHSIEQPIPAGQWQEMATLCETPLIPIALDEELIGLKSEEQKKNLLESIRPQYLIFKPSLIGGIRETREYIRLCMRTGTDWWITSALESNVGLNILAQFCHILKVGKVQGLGTGKLFTNNVESPLRESAGQVFTDPAGIWGDIEEK